MITLAADFGGRRIKLGLVQDGKVLAQEILPAQADRPLEERLPVIAEGFESLCAAKGVRDEDRRGVAFAYPSIIETRSARIMDHFGKFGDARALDLRAWARQRLGLPLAIDNDARMALIGEWRMGAGRGSDNVAIITIGTGLGVSAVIEGRVLRGVHGQAGILGGHITVQCGGRSCVCGNIGCAEAEASTSVLKTALGDQPEHATSALAHKDELSYQTVFQRAGEGDRCAAKLRDHALEVWSALAVNLIHLFDPEILVLGGGVMGSAELILPAVRDYVRKHAHTPWGEVTIAGAELGEKAALLACEWLLQEQTE